MKYFKNTELAALYHVSEKSVRNWISAAKEGKLNLQLYGNNGKQCIANTAKNIYVVEQLVKKGKKYKNTLGHKVITPTSNFYKVFNHKEIFDIISNIDTYREIPLQYSYYNGGAKDWDLYTKKLAREEKPNLLTNTTALLDSNSAYFDSLVSDFFRVNLIDIGVGNGQPAKSLLRHFLTSKKLSRYIGIDISQDMLDIATENLRRWFGDKAPIETHVKDINYERFVDLLAPDSFSDDNAATNIVLFLGSTLPNFRDPSHLLHTIHESMGRNDLLIVSMKPDTKASRLYFDFGGSDERIRLSTQDRLVPELLNLDEGLYEVEQFFDKDKMERRIQIRLTVALTIEFMLEGSQRSIHFNKDESILLWRHKQMSDLETVQLFDENGFELLEAAKSKDRECLLLVLKIKAA